MNQEVENRVILVPWNFSKLSTYALHSAFEIAKDSSLIQVMHVAEPISWPETNGLKESIEQHISQGFEKRFRTQIDNDSLKQVKFCVRYGNVAQEIIRCSEICNARLIVMTASVGDWHGEIPEQVIRMTRCSLLVVQRIESNEFSNRSRQSPARRKSCAVSYRHGM